MVSFSFFVSFHSSILEDLSYFCCINNLKTTKQEHYNEKDCSSFFKFLRRE